VILRFCVRLDYYCSGKGLAPRKPLDVTNQCFGFDDLESGHGGQLNAILIRFTQSCLTLMLWDKRCHHTRCDFCERRFERGCDRILMPTATTVSGICPLVLSRYSGSGVVSRSWQRAVGRVARLQTHFHARVRTPRCFRLFQWISREGGDGENDRESESQFARVCNASKQST